MAAVDGRCVRDPHMQQHTYIWRNVSNGVRPELKRHGITWNPAHQRQACNRNELWNECMGCEQ